jgi:FkbM family methyltransferase
MSLAAKIVKTAFKSLGLEVTRARRYGHDPFRDARNILGPKACVAFDVGANVGLTAITLADQFPSATIWSFEPFPKAFADLKKVSEKCSRIRPINIALGDEEKTQTLFLTNYNPTNSLLPPAAQASVYLEGCMESAGTLSVPVRTLDKFCAEQNIDHVDLLKMDVQGYELSVLRGAKSFLERGKIKLVYTEANFVPLYEQQAYFHDLYNFLLERDFHLVALYDLQYRAGCALNWCDALFVHGSVKPEA